MDKSILNNSLFSPVKYVHTPVKVSSNTIIDKSTLRQNLVRITYIVLSNHEKWVAAEIRGTKLCYQIESIKQNALNASNSVSETNRLTESSTSSLRLTLYPTELQPLCDKLKIITTIFEDCLNSGRESLRQLEVLNGVDDGPHECLLKTWSFHKWFNCFNKLITAYEHEYEMKLKVMQNIAHSRTKNELILHTSVWEYPTYVNERINVELACLKHEISVIH